MTENEIYSVNESIYHRPYLAEYGCLCEEVMTRHGVQHVKLADFVPVLKAEITKDDGTEAKKLFRVSAVHSSGIQLPDVTVTAEEMTAAKWMLAKWGSLGAPQPKHNVQNKICHAIMNTKENVKRETVYLQTGWHRIGNKYFYLLPCENSNFSVELTGKLKNYHFPKACDNLNLIYLADLLEKGFVPEHVLYPMLSIVFLTPLNHFLKSAGCEPKFITALVGRSGYGKSTLAAWLLSFFGTFHSADLPMSFHDTANSILANIYYLKDVLTCIDDFHPSGSYQEQNMKDIAQNLSRYYGDRIGRARLNTKAELQTSRPPTGSAIITAEYTPEISVSGCARYFTLELKEHDMNFKEFEKYASLAESGTLSGMMKAYTDWLKEKMLCDENGFLFLLKNKFLENRNQFQNRLIQENISFHNRVPEMLAHIRIGFEFLLLFLSDKTVLNNDTAEKYKSRLDEILIKNISETSEITENENPTAKFIQKLKTLLDSGRCYVDDRNTQSMTRGKGYIGMEDSLKFYLLADAAHSEVRKLCTEQGEHFTISKNQLLRQLADEKILIRYNNRNTTTIRDNGGKSMNVIVLDKSKMNL